MIAPLPRALAAAGLVALSLAGVAGAQQPDPFLGQQWHLLDRDSEPAGANVRAAWPTTRGLGVVIGIVDDGVQTTHPDLQPNVSLPLSFDFVEGEADPNPRLAGSCNPALLSDVLGEGCHGTAVAGVAAARGDNGLGVSGVAPRATLAGLRLLGRQGAALLPRPIGDADEAMAIGFRTEAIHVKNFSFGPSDDGATLEGPGPLAEAAMLTAATLGRAGRGSVLVWAAGNGGLADNCNFDGYASSRFVIAAGALGDDALAAPYGEPCSALFVVAPSSGGFRGITTTDVVGEPGYDPDGGSYTNRFGGTSSAAPAVSGVAALLLAVNPALTVRDVKHILVRSSFRLRPDDPGAGWTPGPFPHSETFGFGLIDARAAVTTAATWTSVPPESTLPQLSHTFANRQIPDNNAQGLSDTIAVAAPAFTVEHVEVEFDATHPSRGDLEVTLISPAGVASRLATVRPADTGSDFDGWRFRSVRHWGEPAGGTWTLRVADRAVGDVGTWNRWTLRIFGTNGSAAGFVASGRVTTAEGGVGGVTLTFARMDGPGPVPAPVATDANGNWSQSGFAAGVTYRATPGRSGFVFAPPSRDFDVSRNDLDFTASPGCPAAPITPGQTLTGALAATDCRSTQRPLSFADRYTFSGTVGQQVALTMASTAFDTYLYLFRGNGSVPTVLALNDDSGATLNSRIPGTTGFLTLPATETYTVEATSFGAGALGTYTLVLTAASGFSVSGNVSAGGAPLAGVTLTFTRAGGPAPAPVQTDGAGAWSQTGFVPGQGYTVTPSRTGFTFTPAARDFGGPRDDLSFGAAAAGCAGTPIAIGQTVTGALAAGDCPSTLRPGAFADRYTFVGGTAQQVAVALSSTAFDTYVYLLRGNGSPLTVLAFNDDSGGTLNSRIPPGGGFFTLPADATYTLEVTSFSGNATGSYTLALSALPTTGFRVAGQVTTVVAGGATLGLGGVTLAFSRVDTPGTAPAAVQTDATGSWSQAGFTPGGTFRVTPARSGFTFSPPDRPFSNTSATVSFVATPGGCAALPITPGIPVSGALAATDCASSQRPLSFADRYTFTGTAGQQVAISMASSAFDTYLYLLRANGSVLAVLAVNDDSAGTLNSRIPPSAGFVTLPASGTYVIEATSFGGGATGAYLLSLTSPAAGSFAASGRITTSTGGLGGVTLTFTRSGPGPAPLAVTTDADGNWAQLGFATGASYQVTPRRAGFVFVPLVLAFDVAQAASLNFAATASACAPAPIEFGVPAAGALAVTDCLATQRPASFADQYTFNGAAGQQVAITMTSTAFDTYLYLLRSNGTVVAVNDDSGGTLNSRVPPSAGFFTLPADDVYRIETTSFGAGATGAYALSLTSTTAFAVAGRVIEGPGGLPGTLLSFTRLDGGAAPAPVVADVNGNWTQGGFAAGVAYRVTPSRSGFVFSPPAREFTGASALDFVAGCPPAAVGLVAQGALITTDCHSTQRGAAFADRYTFMGGAGQAVAIAMSSAAFDTYLYLFAPNGALIALNDDSGGTLNSRIPFNSGFLLLPMSGLYTIEATSFAGGVTGSYTLNLTTSTAFGVSGRVTNLGFGLPGVTLTFAAVTGPGGVPPPVTTDAGGNWTQGGFANGTTYQVTPGRPGVVFAPGPLAFGGPATLDFAAGCLATPLAVGQAAAGALLATDCRATQRSFAFGDTYVFSGVAGQQVAISMTGPLDTVLFLLDPAGGLLAANDDSGGTVSSRIPANSGFLTLPATGTYAIEATSFFGGATGSYTLALVGGFSASGRVTSGSGGLAGATLSFATVTGPGAAPAAVTTDVNGNWAQAGFTSGTTYRVTPSRAGVTFTPPSRDFGAAAAAGLDFAASCLPAPMGIATAVGGFLGAGDCLSAQRAGAFADRYAFQAPAGQQVAIAMNAAFDTYLYLFDPGGTLIALNDDSGGTLNSRIPVTSGFLTLPATGTYTIEATSFFAGVSNPYTLSIVAPCTSALGVGQLVVGSLAAGDCGSRVRAGVLADRHVFSGVAGQQVVIAMSAAFDTYLYLFGPDGTLMALNDDSGGTLNSRIPATSGVLTLPATGTYTIEATSFSAGVTGSYSLSLTGGSALAGPGPDGAAGTDGARAADDSPTAQFWTPVGDGAASDTGVSADAAGGAGPPAIAVDPVNGEIYAAWESGGSEIHVKKWNGVAWVEVGPGSAGGAGISGTGSARFPALAIKQATLGQPGQPVVAWIDQSSGAWEIYVKEFNGTGWVPAGPGTPAGGGGVSNALGAIASPEEGRPHVVAERGNVFVAWATNAGEASGHGVVVASLRPFTGWAPLAANAALANVASPALEYTAPGYLGARAPSIAVNRNDGNPITVYVTGNAGDATAHADVHVRRWTPSTWTSYGAGAASDTGISGADARPPGYALTSPRVAVGPDGAPHVAWLYSDPQGDRRIRVQRFSASAVSWQPVGSDVTTGNIFVPTPGASPGPALALVIGRDNLPIVAWSQGGAAIHVRKFSPIDGWHELGPGSATAGGVSDSGGPAQFPALAVDAHNNLNVPIVAWLDASTGTPQVYMRRAMSHADLVVESVGVPTTAAAGQPLDVSAVVRNRGGVAAGAFSVGLFLSANATVDPASDRLLTMQQVAGLAPGAQATVTTRLTLPADVTPGPYAIGAFADLGHVVEEVDEANNGLAASHALQVAGPDLIVTGLNGPFTATPSQNLALEVSVKNQAQPPGSAAASRVAVYLSTSPTPGSGVRLGTAPIGALAAGASQTVTTQVLVPGNVSPGAYFLAAIADADHQVAESDEHNNGFNSERALAIVRPDIAVTQVTAPAAGAPGQPLSITSDVKNQAAAPPPQAVTIGKQPPAQPAMAGTSARFRVSFYLSADGTFDPGAPPPLLGGREVERLAPGARSLAATTVTVPSNVSAGTYFVVAVADATGAMAEPDEGNNVRATANPIEIRQPDLAITAVNGPPSRTGAAGRPLAVSVTVKNQAQAPAGAGPFRIAFYLSFSPEPGPGELIGILPVTGLAAGGTPVTLSTTLTVPSTLLDDTYYLSAVADDEHRVADVDRANNALTAAAQVTIGRPDLIVTRVQGPPSGVGAPGQSLAVSLEVKNQAAAPAHAGPFRIGVYLAESGAPGAGTPGAGTLIGSVGVTGVLAGGAPVTVPATLVLPPSITAGTHVLTAVADFDFRIPESDETNNGRTATSPLTIRRPDLIVSRVAGPPTGATGQPLAVTLEVKNQATAPAHAGPFRIGVYLAESGAPDAGTPGAGTLIGNVSVTGALAGGAPVKVPATLVVPASLPAGSYVLSAVVDFTLQVPESDEGNNGLTASAPVTIGRPDLIITRLAGPASGVGAPGQPLAVTAEVKNEAQVPAHAGAFRVAFFLSDTAGPGTGALLGSVNVTMLQAGARLPLVVTFTLPANVSAGARYLSAVADDTGRIPEADDTNNGRVAEGQVQIRQPDLVVVTVAGPATWSPGQPFPVTATVRNQAAAPAAAGPFRLGAFLSTSPEPGSGQLVGFAAIAGLAPSTTSAAITIATSVPAALAPGPYYVSVLPDYDARLAEADEGNNGKTASAQVQIRRADLSVTVLGGPPTGVRGRMIAVANTVANLGNAAASAVRVSFFVSPISAAPGAGRLIGTRDVASLAAMSASAMTTSITLPANLEPGSYFLSAVVDVAGTVAEGVESNNGLTAPAQILVTAQ